MEKQMYLASDIQEALGLGRTTTYQFLRAVSAQENPPFKVLRIGTSVRIPKASFDKWLKEISE